MGCDVHMWIETRPNKDAEWTTDTFHDLHEDADPKEEFIESGHHDRNYHMFAALANVRGQCAPYPARDLPKDLSRTLRDDAKRWEGEAHSHSWLTLPEFKECIDVVTDAGTDRADDYMDTYNKANNWLCNEAAEQQLLSTGFEPQARVVFWFDN